MGLQRSAVGIDLGKDSIKAVQIHVSGSEAVIDERVSLRVDELPEDERGPEGFPKLARHLRRLLVEKGISTSGVTLAIDGADAILRYNHAPPMPPSRLGLIMKYEVESVAERMATTLASDFRSLPTIRDDGEQTVLLGLAREELLTSRLDALQVAGITVATATPAPLALYGAWDLFGVKADLDAPDDDLVVAVDVGRAALNVALILNNRLVFARSASFGGEQFTEALAGEFSVSREKAEKLKIQKGGLDDSMRGVDPRLVGPLRSAAGQLLGLVQSSVRFGSSQTGLSLPAVTRLWVTGGGARLRGLPEYLSRALGNKPVEVFDPEASESDGSFATALGLSAVGLRRPRPGDGGVFLSILPEKYLKKRHFRERTRYLIAAGALLSVLLVAQLAEGFLRNSVASASLETLEEKRDELLGQKGERDRWADESDRIRARVRRILDEAEPTPFQAFVLDFLGNRLRPEIQVESLDLELIEVPADDGSDAVEARYVVVVRGRIDNRSGRAGDWQLELLESLQQEEPVRRVENVIRSGSKDFAAFEFIVHPNSASL